MRRRVASINDLPIAAADRSFIGPRWVLARQIIRVFPVRSSLRTRVLVVTYRKVGWYDCRTHVLAWDVSSTPFHGSLS